VQQRRQVVLPEPLGERDIRQAQRARRAAPRHVDLRRHRVLDGRARVLHLAPRDVAVEVAIDEHRPDEIVQREIPAERDRLSGFR
jgi:hypothetical protein